MSYRSNDIIKDFSVASEGRGEARGDQNVEAPVARSSEQRLG